MSSVGVTVICALADPAAIVSVLRSVEALKRWMHSREPRQQTPRALRSLGQEWAADEETLGAWMETTGQRLDALSAAAAELRELKSAWAATEATLKPDTTPVEIRDRVRGNHLPNETWLTNPPRDALAGPQHTQNDGAISR